MPKLTPPIPQGMLEMIQYADQMIMSVVGVTGDFMGQADSKFMTAQLNAQLVRQGLMVLLLILIPSDYLPSNLVVYSMMHSGFVENCESKLDWPYY